MPTLVHDGKIYSAGFDVALPIKGILEAGETTLVLTDPHISTTSIIKPMVEEAYYGIACPTGIETAEGQCTLTFIQAFDEDIEFGIMLCNGEEYYDRNTMTVSELTVNSEENTFVVPASSWVANTDEGTDSTYYTMKTEITTPGVTGDSAFWWHMIGSGLIPSEDEIESINFVLEAVADVGKVTLYATEAPIVDLNFAMVGGKM